MTNVYLEKIAAMVDREPGLRHDTGTLDFYADRSYAERLREPKDAEHRSNGRKILGAVGMIAGALPPALDRSWRGALVGSVIGGIAGVGLGHILANAGTQQDRDMWLRQAVTDRLYRRYDRHLDIARSKSPPGSPINVILE